MLLGRVEGGVYVSAHWLSDNVQASGLKVPPAPLSLHDTMPIMDEGGFEVSVMDAVRVFALPEVNVAGLDVTFTAVVSSVLFVVKDALPLLVLWVASPL